MERAKKMNCTGKDERLAEMLLDPGAAPVEVRKHVEECDRCSRELDELRATMALLDAWEAPEPNPFFLSRLEAQMREVRSREAEGWLSGWFTRLRVGYATSGGRHVRPVAALALTVVLLVGGGAYLGITDWDQPQAAPGQAAVVNDLQTLDSNAQLLDQLEALSSNTENGD
jgi:anti-sigma factor RsiW